MVGPVQDRPGEVVEPRVQQDERVAADPLDGPDLGHQRTGLGHEVAARLDLQPQRVAEGRFEPLAGRVPEPEVGVQVDPGLARLVGHRQAAAGADGFQLGPHLQRRRLHRPGDLAEVLHVGARADVHVQAGDGHPQGRGPPQGLAEPLVPDPVLAVVAAGVGLAAVAVAEAGVDPQGDRHPRHPRAELVDHVGRAAVAGELGLDDELQRVAVEDVGGVDDLRRVLAEGVARGDRPFGLAHADGVDHRPGPADDVQHRQRRVGLLGVADQVEGAQVGDPSPDGLGLVDISGRAEPTGDLGGGHAEDVGLEGGEGVGGDRHARRVRGRAIAGRDAGTV